MPTDPTIQEQTYPYFLQEVPELLQTIEQGLLSLQENYTIDQVNTLMRAIHTLKGAAASVGLETITILAHSLEDIFKALCRPDVSIDPEIEALLFEGFECLRLPLVAELTGGSINDAEVRDRASTIFAQLQEKLGDLFGQEAYLPSSMELGFDVVQSIFEVGVAQRLEHLATAIANADPEDNPDELITTLRTQADVFLGLAESLNLPGLGAIAQATIAALEHHPDQVMTIAQQTLADLQAAHAAVLAGDRSQGGQPSEPLQQLAQFTKAGVSEAAGSEVDGVQEEVTDSLLESIWGEHVMISDGAPPDPDPTFAALTVSTSGTTLDPEQPSPNSQRSSSFTTAPTPIPAKDPASLSPTVRVNVEHLERLSHSIGELLTTHNQQFLQVEQLYGSVKTLLTQLRQHQQLLTRFQQHNARLNHSTRQSSGHQTQSRLSKKKKRAAKSIPRVQSRVDRVKPDDVSESSQWLQSLLDDAIQLTETSDAIELLTQQLNQIIEKQQRLLTGARDALIEARMVPLGEIVDRFPRILQQLNTRHNKAVGLDLRGTEVLVDKVVAEKLYDPLLHLVRNAFDHGIEPVPIRQQRDKPERGTIEICAYHHGRFLVIEVHDDGGGIDFDLIRQRAIEHHHLSPEQAVRLTPSQLTDFLFQPGFSTAAQVNDLSGRGVGLDVVQNQIQALQGCIEVYSEPQQGTTFKLQIPLSLTIAKLLICQAGSRTYTLFAEAIEQILVPRPGQIREQYGIPVLHWQREDNEQLIPLYTFTQALDYGSKIPPTDLYPLASAGMKPIILFRYRGAWLGLQVDQLLGEQELVIRPLGTLVSSPNYVYGASVLADGQLTLVIDPIALLQRLVDQSQIREMDDRTKSHPALLLSSSSLPAAQSYPTLPTSTDRAPSNQRILLVEDSITVRQGLSLTLQKAGYQVLQAKDGHEAIEKLQHSIDVQLVICDLEMPRVNGFEFLRHRQNVPALADIPVLILTSRSSEKHRLLASQLGATAYMTKPYLEHKLLTIVAEIIERHALVSG